MNYIKGTLLAIISFFLILQSCSTDVEINGKWKDIPIVYCVLDQSSPTQYIKINKSFLGPHPASQMAKHADSLFYNGKITALIDESDVNGNVLSTHYFDRVDDISKEEGYFGNDKNYIWKSDINLNPSSIYKLHIDINEGAHIVTSQTRLISGIRITKPPLNMPSINFKYLDKDAEYEYEDGNNSRALQFEVVFKYREKSSEGIDYKSVTWTQAIVKKEGANSNTKRSGSFSIASFYNFLADKIESPKEGVVRYVEMPNSIIYRLSAVDENYNTFMEISAPSTGLIQERPAFTNINGGYGLFASRTKIENNYKLSDETLDSISKGSYTKGLGFADKIQTNNYYATRSE